MTITHQYPQAFGPGRWSDQYSCSIYLAAHSSPNRLTWLVLQYEGHISNFHSEGYVLTRLMNIFGCPSGPPPGPAYQYRFSKPSASDYRGRLFGTKWTPCSSDQLSEMDRSCHVCTHHHHKSLSAPVPILSDPSPPCPFPLMH